jgi:hypothetical protein
VINSLRLLPRSAGKVEVPGFSGHRTGHSCRSPV